MTEDKHIHSITMQCPTCGGEAFDEGNLPEVRCVQCDRTMTTSELKEANYFRAEAELEDIAAVFVKDTKAKLSKAFKEWK